MIAAGFCFAGRGTMHPFSIRTARGCCSAPSRLWECGGGFAATFPKLHAARYEIAAEGRTHDAQPVYAPGEFAQIRDAFLLALNSSTAWLHGGAHGA
jgi:hypothetical protein